MKKLLGSLLTLSIVSTSAVSVISCSVPTRKIDITLSAGLMHNTASVGDNDDNNLKALNSYYNTFSGFITNITNTLLQTTNSLSGLNGGKQYQNLHNLYVGGENSRIGDTDEFLSIDGLYVGNKDDEADMTLFYEAYRDRDVKINTLEGQYFASKYVDELNYIEVGNDDIEEFYDNYLGRTKSSPNSGIKSMYIEGTSNVINDDIFAIKLDTDGKVHFDTANHAVEDFFDVNTNSKDTREEDDYLIGYNNNVYQIATLANSSPDYNSITGFTRYESSSDVVKTDEGRIDNNWNFSYYANEPTENDENPTDVFVSDRSRLIEASNLSITYIYDTNLKDSLSSEFEIKVDFSNIYATFSPIFNVANRVQAVDENGNKLYIDKDTGETTTVSTGNEILYVGDYERFAVWRLTDYQFNNLVDTKYISNDNKNTPGYGKYSNMNSNISITKINN